MARKRKRKLLVPGLSKLRRRLPGRRAPRPVVVVVEPEPVVSGLPSVAREAAKVEVPVQEDYGPDIDTLGEAVLALGDRVDAQARKVLPVQVDYNPDIQRLDDAVLALGDRVDQMARREG